VTTRRAAGDEDAAVAELRQADPTLGALIDQLGPPTEPWPGVWQSDRFTGLVRTIVGQQISGFAAQAIFNRLVALVGNPPDPKRLLAARDDELRAVGLSRAKMTYVRDLAQRVDSGQLDLDHLDQLSADEVRQQLMAVRGLGRWAADLFLLIQLQDPDVLPAGDLGIRRAIQRLYSLDALPTIGDVDRLGQRWRPHRSLATIYLYRYLRTAPVPQ
jgi:3-methyladenine DNA glycosylase/8-oxoguanine DNA glycosylase